jgi:threonine synthase
MLGNNVWVKFEGINPTGSFKDRGMTMAISKAAEDGAQGCYLCINWKYICGGCSIRS